MATSRRWVFVPSLHVSAWHGVQLFRVPSLLAAKRSPTLQAVFLFKQDVADGDATGEAAALALAAVYKRVRVHVRVASLSRTARARTHVRVFCSTKSTLCLSFFCSPPHVRHTCECACACACTMYSSATVPITAGDAYHRPGETRVTWTQQLVVAHLSESNKYQALI